MLISEDRKSKLNRLFTLTLLCNIGLLVSDLLSWVFEGNMQAFVLPLLKVVNFLVYLFGNLGFWVFNLYLVAYIGTKTHVKKTIIKVVVIISILHAILLIISQFNHMIYDFTPDNHYIRGALFWVPYITTFILCIINMCLTLRYRKALGKNDTIFLLSYELFPTIAIVMQVCFWGIMFLYVAITMSMLLIYISIQVEQSKRLKEQELKLAQSQIAIMVSQIQPHFLFNALTAIEQLCDQDPKKAKKATIDFASYLRGNIDSLAKEGLIPFEKELSHVRGYLNLVQEIYGNTLKIVYNIEEERFLLPSLTIQPIVENAVKHGIGRRESGGTIEIFTCEKEQEYIITISDDGVGFDVEAPIKDNSRTHIGVENVRQRLLAQCSATMEIVSSRGNGTTVTIKVPKVY